jgi:hypothetical protein
MRPLSSTYARLATASAAPASCSTSRRRCRGREAERELDDEKHRRPIHQRPADRAHLLLATGQRAGHLVQPLAQQREEPRHRADIGVAPIPAA